MPKVTVKVPHNLTQEQAIERARPALDKTVSDFEGRDLQIAWNGPAADFSFKSLAFTIKVKVTIDAEQATVDVDLPFAAMMFKDKVEKAIAKNLSRALAPSTSA
jgi:hypothetical protein